ncbi:putative papain-like cysteine peptidase superfamily [Helianthus annuus]|nr:putative papain-like cysteine peptidase superfamily [Helianthus annuus]
MTRKKLNSSVINVRCPRQPGGTECGYYVMEFMKKITYKGVEILDIDNLS